MTKKLNLFIDLPEKFDEGHLLQLKVFEYLDMRPTKYIKDYHIIYRQDKLSSVHIEKLIKDWALDASGFLPLNDKNISVNKAKYACIKELAGEADEALVFFNYKLNDLGSKITIDVCDMQHRLYYRVYRVDYDKFI